MVPASSSAVVVIVRGLGKTSWREIIYYDAKNVDRATLEELILKVEECGAHVQNLVFDMGNTHLQKELGMYEGAISFPNPARESAVVYLVPDACHSLKNLRGNLLKYKATFKLNGRTVKLEKADFIRMKLRDAELGQLQKLHKIRR